MDQKFSLSAAGVFFGISANAMRARAKKNPAKYRMERDNSGKIWVWIDPETLPSTPPAKLTEKGSTLDELNAAIEAFKNQANEALARAVLEERVANLERLLEATKQQSHDLEQHHSQRVADLSADRDAWRTQALELVARRRRWWPFAA